MSRHSSSASGGQTVEFPAPPPPLDERRARSSSTSRSVTGTGTPACAAARTIAPPIASSSIGRPWAASRCIDEVIVAGTASRAATVPGASTDAPAAAATDAISSTMASRSSRRSVRTTPAGAPLWVVSTASGARKTSLPQSSPASSSRRLTSRPARRRWSASRPTSPSTSGRTAISTVAKGLVCSMTPGAVRADSTRMLAATTRASG